MMYRTPKKKNWLNRMFDTVRLKDEDVYDDDEIDYEDAESASGVFEPLPNDDEISSTTNPEEPEAEGELGIDMYQTHNAIVVQAITAGVKLSDIDIDVTREYVSIRGTRTPTSRASRDEFFNQEIYWGPFSREVQLPSEIDIDQAEAVEDHGLLTITLPKLNKDRRTALKVRSV